MHGNRHNLVRRQLLLGLLAALGGGAWRPRSAAALTADAGAADAGASDPHPLLGRTLSRIAFGSCALETRPQPVWDAVLARPNDLFLFLGDAIYADTRDLTVMQAKYARLAAIPGFARLRATTPVLAVWDDHDFGENDAGGDYPMKEESRRLFLDFWNEPPDSPRRARDGVYGAWVFGPPGKRVQVILPDLRYNRTPLVARELGGVSYRTWARRRIKAGLPLPGPFVRNPDPQATMLGERQWQWLERQLAVPAELRLFGSSVQVLADFTGWESWLNFARDRDRLFDLIRRQRANGVVFLSGDMHYAELSRQDVNVPYPMWDLTSSGLTEEYRVPTGNANRVSEVVADANFGFVDIDWQGPDTRLTLGIVDAAGRLRLRQDIALASLALPA